MPAGWFHGQIANPTRLRCHDRAGPAALFLEKLLAGQTDAACDWVKSRLGPNPHPFDQAAVAEDIESLSKMIPEKVQFPAANPPGY